MVVNYDINICKNSQSIKFVFFKNQMFYLSEAVGKTGYVIMSKYT